MMDTAWADGEKDLCAPDTNHRMATGAKQSEDGRHTS